MKQNKKKLWFQASEIQSKSVITHVNMLVYKMISEYLESFCHGHRHVQRRPWARAQGNQLNLELFSSDDMGFEFVVCVSGEFTQVS